MTWAAAGANWARTASWVGLAACSPTLGTASSSAAPSQAKAEEARPRWSSRLAKRGQRLDARARPISPGSPKSLAAHSKPLS